MMSRLVKRTTKRYFGALYCVVLVGNLLSESIESYLVLCLGNETLASKVVGFAFTATLVLDLEAAAARMLENDNSGILTAWFRPNGYKDEVYL